MCVMSMAKSLKISDVSREASDMFDADFASEMFERLLCKSGGMIALRDDRRSKLAASSSGGVIKSLARMCFKKRNNKNGLFLAVFV